MLTGKSIVLGVTGSIAAYKIANLASMLVKLNADVHVIMTQNATHFITPMTFETLTNNKCIVDTFDRNFNFDVKHVSLAKKGQLFLIAPCTANVIGKVANGPCALLAGYEHWYVGESHPAGQPAEAEALWLSYH